MWTAVGGHQRINQQNNHIIPTVFYRISTNETEPSVSYLEIGNQGNIFHSYH